MSITVEDVLTMKPCWSEDELREILGDGMPIREAAGLVESADAIWVGTHLLDRPALLAWLAEDVVGPALSAAPDPDPRSVAVVGALRSGCVTEEVRKAANTAAADRTAEAAAWAARAAGAVDAVSAAGAVDAVSVAVCARLAATCASWAVADAARQCMRDALIARIEKQKAQ